jgi:transposase
VLVKSIVEETLGIKHHLVKQVEETEEGITVQLDLRRRRLLPCGTGGQRGHVRDRLEPRQWKHVPLWGIPVKLV